MADALISELGFDVSSGIQSIIKVQDALVKYSETLDNIVSVGARFNTAGETQLATIRTLDTESNKFAFTLRKVGDQYRIVAASATEAANAQKRAIAAAQDQDRQLNGSIAREVLQNKFAIGPLNGSDSEVNKLQNSIASISNAVSRGRFSLNEFDSAIKAIATGSTNQLIGREQQLADMLLKVSAAYDKVGASASAATKKGADEAAKQITTATRSSNAANAFASGRGLAPSDLSGVDPTKITSFNSAMQSATRLVAQGRVSLADFNTVLGNVKSGNIQVLDGDLGKLQSSLLRAKNSFNEVDEAGGKSGRGILLSWQSVLRLFETQVLFIAFNQLIQGFTEGSKAAAEFSKQIALIETISHDAQLSTKQWSEGIRDLSDKLGLPIADVAAAGYEAISNQVTKGAESFQFLAAAGNLAKTTNSTTTDSVNLLSSAINAFHLNSDQAEQIAGKFFTAIDLGRIKAADLSGSFGRVAQVADVLGVTLDETLASLSSMTRNGISASEGMTLLGQIFNKLIKPSKALKELLHENGFETGQALIAAKGYAGALEFLSKAIDGNAEVAGEFFNEIRGLRGILAQTGPGLKEFTKDLKEFGNSGDSFKKAQEDVNNAFGKKFQDELNKIKNFFIVDVGGTIVKSIVTMTEKVGGLANLIKEITKLVAEFAAVAITAFAVGKIIFFITSVGGIAGAVETGIAAFNALKVATIAWGTTAVTWEAAATGGLSLLAAAIAVAIVKFGEASTQANTALGDTQRSFAEEAAKISDNQRTENNKRLEDFIGGLNKQKQAFLNYTAFLRTEYTKTGEHLREEQKKINDDLKNLFEIMTGTLKQNIAKTEEAQRKAADNIKNARTSIREGVRDAEKALFERNLDTNEHNVKAGGRDSELQLAANRVAELRKQANTELFKEGNLHQAEAAFSEINRILDNLAKKKITLNFANGNTQEVFKFRGVQQDITDELVRQITLKKQFIELQERQLAAAQAEEQKQRENLKTLEDDFTNLQKFTPFEKDGTIKKKFAQDPTKAIGELNALQQKVLDGLGKTGANVSSRIETAENLQKQMDRLVVQLGLQRNNIQAQLDNAIQIKAIGTAEKQFETTIDGLADGARKLTTEQNKHGEALEKSRKEAQALLEVLGGSVESKGLGQSIFSKNSTLFGGASDFKLFADNIKQIQDLVGKADPTSLQQVGQLMVQIRGQLAAFGQQPGSLGLMDEIVGQDAEGKAVTFTQLLSKISEQVVKVRNEGSALTDANQAMGLLQQTSDRLNQSLEQLPNGFGQIPGAAQGAANGAVGALSAIEQATRQAANAVRELNGALSGASAAQSGLVPGKAAGGLVTHMAGGGFLSDFFNGKYARGTDTIPTMLAKDEFVVNAKQTRRFLPQLLAMNAGQVPQYRAEGGPVTNVGDVNVTVQGGPTDDVTISRIARGLQRGLRRGTIKVGN
jgi:TP901 family phage tail tape measure protein